MSTFKTRDGAPTHFIMIKFFDHPTPIKRYVNYGKRVTLEQGIAKVEKLLDGFEWAYLQGPTGKLHYYHNTKGKQQLTAKEYAQAKRPAGALDAYLVVNAKARALGKKSRPLKAVREQDLADLWNDDLDKIILYRDGRKVAEYKNGLLSRA